MFVEVLLADGLRNLAPLQLTPRERFNVFVGDNGQGKTNLLEAIFCIAALRSFRTSKLAELVAFGRETATLAARVKKDDLTRTYEVELRQGGKTARIDGKAVRPLAKYFGGFNVVVFTPEDLQLPRGSPGDRRRFLDRGVFNLDAGYLVVASEYDKVVKTRNSVLRQHAEGRLARDTTEAMLDVYDEQLAKLAVSIVTSRVAFLERLRPELSATFASITRTGITADARYRASTEGLDVAGIVDELRAKRPRDFHTLSTHVGPHRDDVVLMLDEREAGSFASQG
ncbi:MAG TPA: DNA replication and repair protein RecF, partial [Kofleriaceae bacterium]|nr:DNA replication and repair protein RecF [Kofleriaceae bacterium]